MRLGLLLLLMTQISAAYEFATVKEQQQFEQLTQELRCVTCPNQSIADSNAPIAQAMQTLIYQELQAGQTPDEIKQRLLKQYGAYLAYRPAFNPQTWLLWLAPSLLFGFGFWRWYRLCS